MTMIYYRAGDTLPAFRILVEDLGVPVDLTNLDVLVRWQKPDDTAIPEREAAIVSPATNGQADYLWQDGDLNQAGIFYAIVQLRHTGDTERWSLTNPPLVEISVLENVFKPDATLAYLPIPSMTQIAALMRQDMSTLDGVRLDTAIGRARRLAYVYGEFWGSDGSNLTPMDTAILLDLITLLAGMYYLNPPSVTYGPYRSEQYGSYQYELKPTQHTVDNPLKPLTGIPEVDALINYFRLLNKQLTSSIQIDYPEWVRPLIDRVRDPLFFQKHASIVNWEGDDRIWW